MTSLVAKYVAKKILGETAENRFGKEVSRGLKGSKSALSLTFNGIGSVLRAGARSRSWQWSSEEEGQAPA
jgi:hypothetical protein